MNERNEPLGSLAAGMPSRVSAKLDDIWWAFMLRGVLAGVLGIFALIWPTPTFTILTRMIGLYCLADGLPGLVGALRASDRGTYLLQAVVSLVVGGFLLFLPSASARTLLMVFGGWALLVKLVDFGIARYFQPLKTATAIGSQGYAAPEQYRGKAEARSDLYALGATMHH